MAPMMPGAPAAPDGDTLLDKVRPVLGDWMELARMNAKKADRHPARAVPRLLDVPGPARLRQTAKTLGEGTWTALTSVFSGLIRFIGALS